MHLRRKELQNPQISFCGTLLAVFVINACLKNSQLVSATKEDIVDVMTEKTVDDGLTSGSISGSSRFNGEDDLNLFTNSLDDYSRWKFPCFYVPIPYHPHSYNNEGDEDLSGLGKRNFNPWGGKRSRLVDYFRRISETSKKGGFNPWGGKRDPASNSDSNSRSVKNDYPSNRRIPFNPWGGR